MPEASATHVFNCRESPKGRCRADASLSFNAHCKATQSLQSSWRLCEGKSAASVVGSTLVDLGEGAAGVVRSALVDLLPGEGATSVVGSALVDLLGKGAASVVGSALVNLLVEDELHGGELHVVGWWVGKSETWKVY